MNKVIKVFAIVMLFCVALCALVACGEKEVNSIVGFWKNDEAGYDFVYTFNEDGTGSYDSAGTVMPFKYTMDGEKLSITYDGDSISWDTTFKVEGDTLTVIDSAGEDVIYKKTTSGKATKVVGGLEGGSEGEPDQGGYAGINIPLKDNYNEAKYQIEVAMQNMLASQYGDGVADAKIYVEKIYSAEDEEQVPALKDMNLGPDEVAFEVKYELKPAEGTDVNLLTAANGNYDEETGWVTEKYNVGILRPSAGGESDYTIDNLGTGW